MLIKLFDNEKWAKHFLLSGEMLFSETKYFRGYDDEKIRNDSTEGLRQETFAFNISNIDKDIPIKTLMVI